MIHVIVTLRVRPGLLGEFVRLAAAHAAASRTEAGCLRFNVLQGGGPCRFVLLELWQSAEALEAHRQAAHYRRWRAEVPAVLDGERTHEEYVEVPETRP